MGVLVLENKQTAMETPIVTRQGFINGIDVSHNDGDINWAAVAAQGVQFAWIKATEGNDFKDPAFAKNVAGALAHGVRPYAYHFFIPGDNPADQANNFLSVVSGSGVRAAAVDLETKGLDYAIAATDPAGTNVQEFLDLISTLGLPLFVYATKSFLGQYYPQAGFLASFGRWVAKWTDGQPTDTWAFWQWTDSGQVPGISGDVDLDYFNGAVLP